MKARLAYIGTLLLFCTGLLLTPKVSKAGVQEQKQTHACCAAKDTEPVSGKKSCCAKKAKAVQKHNCKQCKGNTCHCSSTLRVNIDPSLNTAMYTVPATLLYREDRLQVPVRDHLFRSAGFYSLWLPPKL